MYDGWTPDWSKATTKSAGAVIDYLFTLPRKAVDAADQAAPGYYVRGDEAFKVVTNKAGTNTYAKVFTPHEGRRPTWEYAPGVGKSLARDGLVPMTAEDAARIGLQSGYCINCCAALGGETLSARVSALIGYGETCASNNGWFYPKGAKAQRAFIATDSADENEAWAAWKTVAAHREAEQEAAAYVAE